YKPSYIAGVVVPTYAAGLPLQMAMLARAFGLAGSLVVVPISGGLAVWATYQLGLQLSRSQMSALLSALLTACSPVFLYQLMQPMSDVPVTAWWLLTIVAALDPTYIGAAGAGLCGSLAILIRPNLAPLILPAAAYVAYGQEFRGRVRALRVALFGAGLLPGIALTAAIHTAFFGSPFRSGYGTFSDIYRLGNAVANLIRY